MRRPYPIEVVSVTAAEAEGTPPNPGASQTLGKPFFVTRAVFEDERKRLLVNSAAEAAPSPLWLHEAELTQPLRHTSALPDDA